MKYIKYDLIILVGICCLCVFMPDYWFVFVGISWIYFLIVSSYDRWWHDKLEDHLREWKEKYYRKNEPSFDEDGARMSEAAEETLNEYVAKLKEVEHNGKMEQNDDETTAVKDQSSLGISGERLQLIEQILDGIDRDETDNNGWWETSKGVDFGKGKLEEIRNLFFAGAEVMTT